MVKWPPHPPVLRGERERGDREEREARGANGNAVDAQNGKTSKGVKEVAGTNTLRGSGNWIVSIIARRLRGR